MRFQEDDYQNVQQDAKYDDDDDDQKLHYCMAQAKESGGGYSVLFQSKTMEKFVLFFFLSSFLFSTHTMHECIRGAWGTENPEIGSWIRRRWQDG